MYDSHWNLQSSHSRFRNSCFTCGRLCILRISMSAYYPLFCKWCLYFLICILPKIRRSALYNWEPFLSQAISFVCCESSLLWNFCSMELSFPRNLLFPRNKKFSGNKCSLFQGTFLPKEGKFHCMELTYAGTKVLRNEKAWHPFYHV